MAVLAGAFSVSPPPPGSARAAALLASLPRPSESASTHWEDAAGLASLAGATVLGEPTVEAGDGLAVVVNARLDDPDALARQLGAASPLSDAALIRRAYQRWGSDCVHHLDGDFAFVLWDEQDRRVFAARDRFGNRPLVYAQRGDQLWVASQPRVVLAAGVDRQPDLWYIAQVVVGAAVDPEVTAFSSVRRLPAGHRLMWSGDSVRTDRYWRPDLALPISQAPLPETASQFREAFDVSVSRRIAVSPSFGAFLSGGLDSSSVVATARVHRADAFPVFTAIYPGLERADERAYADELANHIGVIPQYVQPLTRSPVAEHDAEALGIDEPFYMPTWAMEKALLDAAQEHGVRALLSGHGGDHVLHGSPLGIYGDWIRTGRWSRLLREARTVTPSWGDAARLIWEVGLKDLIRQRQPAALRRVRQSPVPPLLNAELAAALRYPDRMASFDTAMLSSRHRVAAFVHHPPTHAGLERMASVCEAMGLSFQTPYWDRSVVNLCLSVPRHHLLKGGVERVLIREAMRGRLPDLVRTRTTKATFDPLLNVTLHRHARSEIGAMLDAPGELATWFHMPTLRGMAERFLEATEADLSAMRSGEAQALLRAVTLWHWKRRTAGGGFG